VDAKDAKVEWTVLGGEEAEEALHLLRSMVECGRSDQAVDVRQQQMVVGTATIDGGLDVRSWRGEHREPVWLCSMSSLSTDCRAEGATRCRDVSNEETFANRADSQVGSARLSRDSGAERVVGAGERGRRRRAVGCGWISGIEPMSLAMFCHASSSCCTRTLRAAFSCTIEVSDSWGRDDWTPCLRARFSASSSATRVVRSENRTFLRSREHWAAIRLRWARASRRSSGVRPLLDRRFAPVERLASSCGSGLYSEAESTEG